MLHVDQAGNEILVRLHTSDPDLEPGIGLCTSYTDLAPLLKPWRASSSGRSLQQFLIGRDPLRPEVIYQELFALTHHRLAKEEGWTNEAIIRLSSAIDIACWDLIGKVAKLPLYKLFGSSTPTHSLCTATPRLLGKLRRCCLTGVCGCRRLARRGQLLRLRA